MAEEKRLPKGLGYKPDPKDERDMLWRSAVIRERISVPVTHTLENLGPVLNQLQEPRCFPAGTNVRLESGGHKKIEDIKSLDRVVTAEGNVGLVTGTEVKFHNGYLVNLVLWGHKHLLCTPEHPILTERGYVAAKDLQPTDYVAMTKHLTQSKDILYTNDYLAVEVTEVSKRRQKTVNYKKQEVKSRTYKNSIHGTSVTVLETLMPETIVMDYRFGRIIGLYAAEGSTRSRGYATSWSFNSKELGFIEEVKSYVTEVLNGDVYIQKKSNNCTAVNVYSKPFSTLISKLVSGDCYTKKIHDDILSGNKEFLRGVLDGWVDGDGHIAKSKKTGKNSKVQAVTVSSDLALNMYGIAQTLGRRPTIISSKPSMNVHAKTRAMRWDVSWPLTTAIADGKGWNWRAKETDHAVFRKVKELIFTPFAGYVFNLHVEGDNSYVAEGVGVHNCVAFSSASQKFYSEYLQHGHYFDFDPIWLYDECKKKDGIPNEGGTFIRVALEIMHAVGYKAKAGTGGLLEDAYFKIDNHVRLTSLQQIKEAIYTIGPVLFGIGVDQGIFYPDESGIVAEPNGQVEGGHAMLICGWDDSKECKGSVGAFWVKNSWGKSYGLDGYMWLPYSHFTAYEDWDAWKTVDSSEVLFNPQPTVDPIVEDPAIVEPVPEPTPDPENDADPLDPTERDPSGSYCRCLCDGCKENCKGWKPPNA